MLFCWDGVLGAVPLALLRGSGSGRWVLPFWGSVQLLRLLWGSLFRWYFRCRFRCRDLCLRSLVLIACVLGYGARRPTGRPLCVCLLFRGAGCVLLDRLLLVTFFCRLLSVVWLRGRVGYVSLSCVSVFLSIPSVKGGEGSWS